MKLVIQFGDSIDTMDIKFKFKDLLLELQLMMKMRVATLMNMQVQGMSTSGCMLSTVEEMELIDLIIGMGDVEIDIATTTLTSSTRWLYGGTNVSQLLNKIFAAMFWGAKPVVNDLVKSILGDSAETCANGGVPVEKPPVLTPVQSALAWVSVISLQNLFGLFFLLFLLYLYRYNGSKTAQKKKLALAKKCMDEGNIEDAEKLLEGMKPNTNWNTAMVFHPDIHPAIRYGVVCIQLSLFGLYLWANMGAGASVDLYLKIAQDPIVIKDLFLFTLGGTITDMLNAGVYFLAIIIICFSGIYPYAKVATHLYCWCMPTDMLPPKKRENILIFIGSIGKWSLVDTFVLFLMMVAFNMRISLQDGDITADVFIVTKFGFYGFLFATMLSLSMGSVVLWFHRYTTTYVEIEEGGDEISLSEMKHRYGKLQVKSTERGRYIVGAVLTFTAMLSVWGSFVPSFSFDIQGLAGMAVELSPDSSPTNTYSLLTMGLMIPEATRIPNDVMIRWCQMTYFIFALICPMCYLVCLWSLWCCKFTLATQRTLYVMLEVFSEWAAMEVFVISIVACSAQIGKLAYFMVGGACDELDVILQEAMSVDKEIKSFVDEPTCFGVAANLEFGASILLVACIIFTVVGGYLQKFCLRGLEARLHEAPAAREHRSITRRLTAAVPNMFPPLEDQEADMPMTDEPIHANEKIGCLNRNLFNFCDWIGMVEIIDDDTGERVTLGFALEDVEEGVDGVADIGTRRRGSTHTPQNELHFEFKANRPSKIEEEPKEPKERMGTIDSEDSEGVYPVVNPLAPGVRAGVEMSTLRKPSLEKKDEGGGDISMSSLRKDIQNCKLNSMSVSDVCSAMDKDLNLKQYSEGFLCEGIDGPVLVAMALDSEMLEDCLKEDLLVKSALHRSKIKAWIAKNMR